jgi:hypothetical protein
LLKVLENTVILHQVFKVAFIENTSNLFHVQRSSSQTFCADVFFEHVGTMVRSKLHPAGSQRRTRRRTTAIYLAYL